MKKIVFIITALIIIVGGFLIFNNSNIFNSNKVDENSIVGKIEYNATINSDWNEIEALKTLSEDTFFYEIDESNNYDFNGDVLTVSNGVVSVSGEDNFNAKIKDVYKMYLVIGDYNHQYAFLTKSGDVFVGANLITYKNEDYGLVSEKEFNKLYTEKIVEFVGFDSKINIDNSGDSLLGNLFLDIISDIFLLKL